MLTHLIDFSKLFVIVYLITFGFYLGFGYVLHCITARTPERRIQPKRDGLKRARIEIMQSAWALVSTSLCFAAALYIQRQGWGLFDPFTNTWITAVVGFVVGLIIYDAWFYWVHRAMHTKWLYRFHQFHHKSVAPTVWSNDSASFVDDLSIKLCFVALAFFLPIPVVALIAIRVFDQAKGMIGHCGHEFFASPSTRFPTPFVCTMFHDRHHSHFKFNYANTFTIWDRLFGTIDPKYDSRVKDWELRFPKPWSREIKNGEKSA